MKKLIILIVFHLITLTSLATSMKDIRNSFFKASQNEIQFANFSQLVYDMKFANQTTEQAYKSAVIIINSNFLSSPWSKLKYFNNGKHILDQIIISNPIHLESRFLRYCIQERSPAFLGYKNHLIEDKLYIRNAIINEKDLDLVEHINTYFKQKLN